jgi:hypothetical protein
LTGTIPGFRPGIVRQRLGRRIDLAGVCHGLGRHLDGYRGAGQVVACGCPTRQRVAIDRRAVDPGERSVARSSISLRSIQRQPV